MKPLQSDDPVKCAEAIIDRVGRRILLGVPIGIGKPNRLLNALYLLAEADRGITLEIFTGLSLARPPGDWGLSHDRGPRLGRAD